MSLPDSPDTVASAARATLARYGDSQAFGETLDSKREGAPAPQTEPAAFPLGPDGPPALPGHEDLSVSQVLAQGGMGRVLLARQKSLQREVAVKTVRPERVNEKTARELLDESVIAGSLEHPNIIPVHSLGFDDAGHPFLVMKRAEGVAWGDLIADPAHPAWERLAPPDQDRLSTHLEILRAVCSAAHFAHRRGVIHRDIKPANVMVGELGEVYLVDWGIATALDPADARYRLPALGLVGTPAFMAPEMVRDDGGPVDARTDVYLLGATLHALLTGKPPHEGHTLLEVFLAASASAPSPHGPDVPAELGAIAHQAMHRDPGQRFASAAAFRQALGGYLDHRASIALSDKARARLERLRTSWAGAAGSDADRLRDRRLLAECRLGFEHALESWPGNPRAHDGVRECALLALRDEVDRGNLIGAEALLLEVGDAPPALREAVAALRAAHQEREARDARFRALEQKDDWRVAAGLRVGFFLALAALVTGLWLWANGGQVRYQGHLSPRQLATTVGAALAIATVLVALTRRRLLTSRVNERLVYGVLLSIAAMFANRVANIFPVPYAATLVSTELLFCAYGSALGGLALARWLWLQVPVWLAGAFLVRAFPSVAGLIFACSALVALGLGAWRLSRPVSGP